MQAGYHYGPQPDFANSRPDWTSVYYHRADEKGLGFDRTSEGSNAVAQYFWPLCEIFDDIDTCPEKYLLWFHHVPWDWKMKSGRSLWEELCYRYNLGTKYVDKMIKDWQSVKQYIDPQIFSHVGDKLQRQREDAGVWRDTCISYFQQFSKKLIPDLK
jgi:alpha-glucuronidase